MARNKYRLCPDWKYRTYFDWIWNVELSKTLIIVDCKPWPTIRPPCEAASECMLTARLRACTSSIWPS